MTVRQVLSGDQLCDGDTQGPGKGFQCGDIRCTQSPFPFAYGAVGDVQQLSQILLRHAAVFARFADESPHFCGVHQAVLLIFLLYGSAAAEKKQQTAG